MTFHGCHNRVERLNEAGHGDVPKLLVGLQADRRLVSDSAVQHDEAMNLARSLGLHYTQCSSTADLDSVNAVFETAVLLAGDNVPAARRRKGACLLL